MSSTKQKSLHLTRHILIAMILGCVVGLLVKFLPIGTDLSKFLVTDVFKTGGAIFFGLLKMLVVPVVFVSLVCGSSALGSVRKLGRIGAKTFVLYLLTTALAITLALTIASFFGLGKGIDLSVPAQFTAEHVPSFKEVLLNIVPSNIFKGLAEANMLQVIVFALFIGLSMTMAGDKAEPVRTFFDSMNAVMMKLVMIVMVIAPYGVFCLLAALFAEQGFALIYELLGYFCAVLAVLFIQLLVTYPIFLKLLARLNPLHFFKQMYSALLFAFSVSSSSASIPVVLKTVEEKLNVKNSIASFVIPLGATINMDGTAIMQGVATVFIAHAYHVDIGLVGYLTVIFMATLASVGTAGVPSVGLITLAMVLQQVGLPVEGIGLIIGVDRLLDMTRTSVNVAGDATIACIVDRSER